MNSLWQFNPCNPDCSPPAIFSDARFVFLGCPVAGVFYQIKYGSTVLWSGFSDSNGVAHSYGTPYVFSATHEWSKTGWRSDPEAAWVYVPASEQYVPGSDPPRTYSYMFLFPETLTGTDENGDFDIDVLWGTFNRVAAACRTYAGSGLVSAGTSPYCTSGDPTGGNVAMSMIIVPRWTLPTATEWGRIWHVQGQYRVWVNFYSGEFSMVASHCVPATPPITTLPGTAADGGCFANSADCVGNSGACGPDIVVPLFQLPDPSHRTVPIPTNSITIHVPT